MATYTEVGRGIRCQQRDEQLYRDLAARGMLNTVPVLEASEPIECAACGQTINQGERFIRRMLRGGSSYRVWSVCKRCTHFIEVES